MYKMYMATAEKLYNIAVSQRETGVFGEYGTSVEQENFEYFIFDKLSHANTTMTIGYEGITNIGFALINCMKEIDLPLAEKMERELNKQYSRCRYTGKAEDICQRYFHYGKEHVANIIKMIDNYHKTLTDVRESKFDNSIIKIIPTINRILNEQTEVRTNDEVQSLISELENSDCNLATFCDDVERKLHKSFIKSLNSETENTVKEILLNDSKLKIMDGQEFSLLIHSSGDAENFLNNDWDNSHNVLSTTLIDDKNIRCYQSSNVKFAFYQELQPSEVVSAFSRDASSTINDDGALSTFSLPSYVPAKNFKAQTRAGQGLSGYSEILVKNTIIPDAIVSFDYVTEDEKRLADTYGLHVILIQTECYKDMLKDNSVRDERFVKKADLSSFEKEYEI